jgi:hypothetical protein
VVAGRLRRATSLVVEVRGTDLCITNNSMSPFVPSLIEVIRGRGMEYARPSFERSRRDGRGHEHGKKAGDVMVFEMDKWPG